MTIYDLKGFPSARRDRALAVTPESPLGRVLAQMETDLGEAGVIPAREFLAYIEAPAQGVAIENAIMTSEVVLPCLRPLVVAKVRPALDRIIAGCELLAQRTDLLRTHCPRAKLLPPPAGGPMPKLHTPYPFIECSPRYALLATQPMGEGVRQWQTLLVAYLLIQRATPYEGHLRFSRQARILAEPDTDGKVKKALCDLPVGTYKSEEYLAKLKGVIGAETLASLFALASGARSLRERNRASVSVVRTTSEYVGPRGRFTDEDDASVLPLESSDFALDGNPLDDLGAGTVRPAKLLAFHEASAQCLSVGATDVATPKAVAFLIAEATRFREDADSTDTAARLVLCCVLRYGCTFDLAVDVVLGCPADIEMMPSRSRWRVHTDSIERLEQSNPLPKAFAEEAKPHLDLSIPPELDMQFRALRTTALDKDSVKSRAAEILAAARAASGVRLTMAMLSKTLPAALRNVGADEVDVALITLQAPRTWAIVYTNRSSASLRKLHRRAIERILHSCEDWECARFGIAILAKEPKRRMRDTRVGGKRTPKVEVIRRLLDDLRKATRTGVKSNERWNAFVLYVYLTARLATMSRPDFHQMKRFTDFCDERRLIVLSDKDAVGFLRTRLAPVHSGVADQLRHFAEVWRRCMEDAMENRKGALEFGMGVSTMDREKERKARESTDCGFVLIDDHGHLQPLSKKAIDFHLRRISGETAPTFDVIAASRHFTRSYLSGAGVSTRALMQFGGHGSYANFPSHRHAIGSTERTRQEWMEGIDKMLNDIGWELLEFTS